MKSPTLFVLSIAVTALLAACAGTDPTPTPAPPVAPEAATSSAMAEADGGWFLRTIAPLGDERGLCMDLVGWTSTNINFDAPVQAHTCKHGWWSMDGRFDTTALNEGRLEMPYFERCLEVAALEIGSSFFVLPCDGGERQEFAHLETGQIVLAGNPALCIGIPDEPHRDAGGDDFVVNRLNLDACSQKNVDRQRWVFTEPL